MRSVPTAHCTLVVGLIYEVADDFVRLQSVASSRPSPCVQLVLALQICSRCHVQQRPRPNAALAPVAGVASELALVWLALPTIRDTSLWAVRLPNAVNFEFDYYITCIIVAAIYAPGVQ